jgi:Tfp pilus assembly PilM family ATPase
MPEPNAVPSTQKKSGLASLKFLASMVTGPKDILGVDLGSHSVKVVLLVPQQNAYTLQAWGLLPIDTPPDATPEEKNQRASKLLKDFLHSKGIQHVVAATSVSEIGRAHV